MPLPGCDASFFPAASATEGATTCDGVRTGAPIQLNLAASRLRTGNTLATSTGKGWGHVVGRLGCHIFAGVYGGRRDYLWSPSGVTYPNQFSSCSLKKREVPSPVVMPWGKWLPSTGCDVPFLAETSRTGGISCPGVRRRRAIQLDSALPTLKRKEEKTCHSELKG